MLPHPESDVQQRRELGCAPARASGERSGQLRLHERGQASLEPRQPRRPAGELGQVAHRREPRAHPFERAAQRRRVARGEQVVRAGEQAREGRPLVQGARRRLRRRVHALERGQRRGRGLRGLRRRGDAVARRRRRAVEDRRVRLEARRVRRRRGDPFEDRRGGLLEGKRRRVYQDLQARFGVGEEAVFFVRGKRRRRRRFEFFFPSSSSSSSLRSRPPIVVINLILSLHHERSLFHPLSIGAARAEQVDPFRRVKVRRPEVGGVERDGHVFFNRWVRRRSNQSIKSNSLPVVFGLEECTRFFVRARRRGRLLDA